MSSFGGKFRVVSDRKSTPWSDLCIKLNLIVCAIFADHNLLYISYIYYVHVNYILNQNHLCHLSRPGTKKKSLSNCSKQKCRGFFSDEMFLADHGIIIISHDIGLITHLVQEL